MPESAVKPGFPATPWPRRDATAAAACREAEQRYIRQRPQATRVTQCNRPRLQRAWEGGPDTDGTLVDPAIWKLVEDILGAELDLAVAVTGGGSRAVTWLLDHPGASRAVVEAQVPYHSRALEDYLGQTGPHRVTSETARRMARHAHRRAGGLAATPRRHIGVACTAALATSRERRGRDRAFLALRLDDEYRLVDVQLPPGSDRSTQEEMVSRSLIGALAQACGVASAELPAGGSGDVPAASRACAAQGPLEELLDGDRQLVEWRADGCDGARAAGAGRLLLPGSFNPLHAGHRGLATAAARHCGWPPALELSVLNVDKPPLSYEQLSGRLQPLRGQFDVVVTRAPTFVEKARLLPGTCFAIGYDTAVRLFDARYYDEDPAAVSRVPAEIRVTGCRFLVAGRRIEGEYRTLADLRVPAGWTDLLDSIPERAFRCDVSSTELRSGELAARPNEEGR